MLYNGLKPKFVLEKTLEMQNLLQNHFCTNLCSFTIELKIP